MSRGAFRGGVHPPEGKELSSHRAVEPLPPPPVAYLSLSQHVGAPSIPVVAKGNTVCVGQPVADAGGHVSAILHAPISGKVKGIEERPHVMRARGPALVIENDGLDTPWEGARSAPLDAMALDPKQIVAEIRQAGIVGMGGAAFPTHVKLSPPPSKPLDVLIANGVECEPFLTADHRLMLEAPREALDGLRIAMRAVGVKRAIVAIEANKPDAIAAMRQAAAGAGDLEVRELPVRYPQGAEKQLIAACLGREVPCGGLPMDVGVVVLNIGTCHAIHMWFQTGRPLIERIVTVSGHGVRQPKNLRVRIGTPFQQLLDACGGLDEKTGKLIAGGPMMGLAQSSAEAAVTKGTSGLIALVRDAVMEEPERPCVNCARCTDACPMGLVPSLITAAAARNRLDEAAYYGLLDCIECGCCAYVCPSRRYLVQYIRHGKAETQRRKAAAKTKSAAKPTP